jgi:hypothetical protein
MVVLGMLLTNFSDYILNSYGYYKTLFSLFALVLQPGVSAQIVQKFGDSNT